MAISVREREQIVTAGGAANYFQNAPLAQVHADAIQARNEAIAAAKSDSWNPVGNFLGSDFFSVLAPAAIALTVGGAAPLAAAAGELAVEAASEVSVFDWLSNAWSGVTDWFSGSTSAEQVYEGVSDVGGAVIDESGAFGGGGFSSDIWPEMAGSDWTRIAAQGAGQIFTDTPNGPPAMLPGVMPAMGAASRIFPMLGAGAAEVAARAGMTAGGAMAGMTLATVFGAARGAGTFVLNGVRGTIPQLWKYTRRFGPQAVATALGIGVAELGTILLQNPEQPRRRRRGISARDIRTTKRVVNFVTRISHQIGCVRAPRHFTRHRRA